MDDKHLGDQFPVIEGRTMGFEERKYQHNWSQTNTMVTKPWGSYTDYYRTEKVVFKTICVKPSERLSLQSHEGRTELWYVVEGEWVCELSGNTLTLTEGMTIIIPTNSKHRLSNESGGMCVIAEMQYGVCSEEDIIRYEDDYNRD